MAEVELDCVFGHVITKAAVLRDSLDQGKYLLGNKTAALFEEVKKNKEIQVYMVNAVETRSQKKLTEESKQDLNMSEETIPEINEKNKESPTTNCHEAAAAHLEVTKTKDAIFKTFYWPKCFSDVEDFVKTCDKCQRVERFGVKVVRSSVYNPQSNPVERMHRTLKRILNLLCINPLKHDEEEDTPSLELENESNLFSNIPGCTDLAEHDIELESERAIVAKPYRMSPRQIEILKSEVHKMLELKIIEPGESDFTSPLILVEAQGKEARPCIDYRRLNKVTRTQFFPLPNIEELLEKVSAAKYISILDLTRGYWQIPLSPRAQRYASFVTTFGTFKPLRLPFGLKNAPYYFSRLMANLLRNCEDFAVPYLDDIAIFSLCLKDDHLKHLKDVKYLGHLVGQGLRTPGELKVQVIKDFPIPTNKTQGRNRKSTVDWNSSCQNAFEELKTRLSKNPVLYSPDFTKPFIIQCDASNLGIGVVLSQVCENEEHPIMFLSKKLSLAEQKYSTTEKECAAIIFAVQKLKCYLDGHQKFIIQTDHNPLVWLEKNTGTKIQDY
ncbi:retrovirus-related Pol polyprotein from transposon 297 [Trichonephila clavipes]|nr:retrovirus-related Pol polyprotein from transposon 297 [Trichonephila clavipes]